MKLLGAWVPLHRSPGRDTSGYAGARTLTFPTLGAHAEPCRLSKKAEEYLHQAQHTQVVRDGQNLLRLITAQVYVQILSSKKGRATVLVSSVIACSNRECVVKRCENWGARYHGYMV